jgi:hypothetical protein
MSEFREWDWPPYPERHGARRRTRTSQPVLDLNIQVTGGDRPPPRRALRYRYMAGLARVVVGVVKIGLGAAVGVAVVLAIWFGATVIRHM